jgi:4-hydroxybenzoate polyprenyltransferase
MISLAVFRVLTRIEQTFFALPFVFASMLLCQSAFTLRWLLVIPAFMLARISGMAFNQLIDSKIDARNPRTQMRVIPSGRATRMQVGCIAWGALLFFVLLCLQINLLTAYLALLAAFLLFIYSFMKRIHYACHAVLGLIHFFGPVMTFSALTGIIPPVSLFLGGAAALLVVGSDIIYAIQDYEFDCANGLYSIPAKFGIKKSLVISTCVHCGSVAMLLGVGLSAHLSWIYYAVLPFTLVVIAYFRLKLRNIAKVFFYCNVTFSFTVLLFIFLSRLCHAML